MEIEMKKIDMPIFAVGTVFAIALAFPLSASAQNASETLFKAKCATWELN
jgi:hypothetical protein